MNANSKYLFAKTIDFSFLSKILNDGQNLSKYAILQRSKIRANALSIGFQALKTVSGILDEIENKEAFLPPFLVQNEED